MSLRCIVVDDEPLAKMLIENYISRTPWLELASSFTSAKDASCAISKGDADVAFLDIEMPGISGLQLAKEAEQAGMRVIFTTAFRDYAIDGFRVNALDYLLKPVSYEEFLKAANRANSAVALNEPKGETATDFMTVRSNYRTVCVPFEDIVFVEGLRDYVKIHQQGEERPLLTQVSLKAIDALLSDGFSRIHRSYIVRRGAVKSFNRTSVTVESPADGSPITLPIGDTYRASFMKLMSADK